MRIEPSLTRFLQQHFLSSPWRFLLLLRLSTHVAISTNLMQRPAMAAARAESGSDNVAWAKAYRYTTLDVSQGEWQDLSGQICRAVKTIPD